MRGRRVDDAGQRVVASADVDRAARRLGREGIAALEQHRFAERRKHTSYAAAADDNRRHVGGGH